MDNMSKPTIKPVRVMLLDLQMPIKNGLKVVTELKQLFKKLREEHPDIYVIEPTYVFLTAFSTQAFRTYLQTINIKHCYEKPISGALLK
jgi:CheY-like chemotaxis protein